MNIFLPWLFVLNIFRLNTRQKDTSLGGYFTQSQQGSPIRRVYENNMDEFSFNTVDVSILKTINSTHQAYFDLVSTIKENVKFGCKVWKENIPMYLISPSVIHRAKFCEKKIENKEINFKNRVIQTTGCNNTGTVYHPMYLI